jgi:glutaredoxin-related protein
MKTLLLSIFLFISIYVNASYVITIYGSNSCGYTSALRASLTKENIQFTYCNIEIFNCFNDMSNVVYEFKLAVKNSQGKDSVGLPVVLVVVDGVRYGFVRPSTATIKALVANTSAKELYVIVEPLIGIVGAKELEVYTLSGVRILSSHENYINIHSLSSGVYILRINKRTTYKFVKY